MRPPKGTEVELEELQKQADKEKNRVEQLKQSGRTRSAAYRQGKRQLAQLQLKIDRLNGKGTNASVDSELPMVLFGAYDLYRWQPNLLKNDALGLPFGTSS